MGAGYQIRTGVSTLEGWHTTIVLIPHFTSRVGDVRFELTASRSQTVRATVAPIPEFSVLIILRSKLIFKLTFQYELPLDRRFFRC